MNSTSEFAPQWASPPGETIAEALAARGWSRVQFASHLGQSVEMVESLLKGATPITIGLARRLNEVIGASVAFWMARDLQYREDSERQRRAEQEWAASLPVDDMVRLGWLPSEVADEVEPLLNFFDVDSVPAWRRRYSTILESVAFRASATFESDPAAVVAWIRQAERTVAQTVVEPWDPEKLVELLVGVRSLSRLGRPERFLPVLRRTMAKAGVVVATVPAPTGCRASGAALWPNDRTALVLLSGRHLTDDHFWFTFYHECGHLLLHRDTTPFVDEDAAVGVGYPDANGPTAQRGKEQEANEFAMSTLVTPDVAEALRRIPTTYKSVLKLAAEAGIAPGILTGQLQNMGRVGPERLNRLKRRFAWIDGELVSRRKT